MSEILELDFGYDDNVRSSIKKAKRAIESRISDYSGIKKDLNGISTNTSNLSNANSYLNKKINALQGKADRLEQFEGAVKSFNDYAESQDKLVANHIKKETKSFCKREGIPNGFLYTVCAVIGDGIAYLKGKVAKVIEGIKEGLSTAWEAVKKWYEDNKHWIDVVVDAVCAVAAVVAAVAAVAALVLGTATGITAILAAIFAVWGVATSLTDLVYDSEALVAYNDGDMQRYEELSKGNLGTLLERYKIPGAKYIYNGMEIASAVFSIYKIGSAGFKMIKGESTFLDLVKKTVGLKSEADVTSTIAKAMQGGNTIGQIQLLYNISKADVILSNTKFAIKGVQNFFDNAPGKATIKTIKLSYSFDKIISKFKEIIPKTNSLMCCCYGGFK